MTKFLSAVIALFVGIVAIYGIYLGTIGLFQVWIDRKWRKKK